ncbi:hypothetical protein MUG94_13770 [Arthrobacter gengyunqii]|uniref:DUF2339 domain-containing protein n=1 Tax=Arthrobacter gengyunqii TaxID=2886940 RepID=A0A9X1S6B0_9MICC|nr:hypothetical protein [Arthrobacter gengyunqii]MCC3268184.1 hypothetical protein [Arthrobacter gengyunqii]UOY95596.1 hypothetical protein MUG94_13770 [Arthrobacter gengyunqii]
MVLVVGAALALLGMGFALGWFCRGGFQPPVASVPEPAACEAGADALRSSAAPGTAEPPRTPRLPGPPPESERVSSQPVLSPEFASPSAVAEPARPLPTHPARPLSARPTHAEPVIPAGVPSDPQELAVLRAAEEAGKQRRDLRNINITLYAACLLLLAAASLFIGLAIPETARFAGVTAVAGIFYAGGLAVHARIRRLRPAGVAFTGTGLALIPVVGLALNNFVLRDGPLAWLATSIVGTAAFAYAAAKLDSRVVAYLSMTFLLSTALASGAALRSGIVWYFLCTVLLATGISLLAIRRPSWLNNLYLDAFVRSHRFLVPATGAVAVVTAAELGGWQFSILFLSFAGYYAVVFLQSPRRERLMNSYGFRISATAGLAVLGYKLSDDAGISILVVSLLLLFQTAGLLAWRRHYDAVGGKRFFGADLILLLCLQAAAGVAAGIEASVSGDAAGLAVFTITAVLVLMTFMAAVVKVQFVPAVTVAAVVLPGFIPRMFDPESGSLWTAVLLGVLLVAFLAVRAVSATGGARQDFILGGRLAATGLVPVLSVAAMEAAGLGAQTVWTWALALSAAAVLVNQMLSVVQLVAGRPVRFAGATLGVAFGLVPVLTVWLRFVEEPGTVLTLCVLFAAPAVNVLTSVVLRGFFASRSWLEWVGPGGFAAAAVIGAGLLGLRGYEVLVGAALLYCGFMALRWARVEMRGRYVLAAQVLLTVLTALIVADLDLSVHGVFVAVAVSVAVQQLARTVFQDRFAGVGLGQLVLAAQWGSVAVLALLPLAYAQIAVPRQTATYLLLIGIAVGMALFVQAATGTGLVAGRPVRFAGATLGVAFGLVPVLTVWLRFVEEPGTVLTLCVLFAALAVNVLTSVVLRGFFASRSWLEWVGPGGFAAAAVIGAGLLGLRGYEVLVGAALLYCGFMALRWARVEMRGRYVLAAQVLLTVLTALIVADLDLSVHGVFVAVAVSVAVQQLARTVFQDRFAGVGLGQLVLAAQWGSVAVLALLPLAYYLMAGRGIQRHVVALSLVLLLSVSLAAYSKYRNGSALYAGVYALGVLPVVLAPVLGFSSGGILGGGPGAAESPLSLAGACVTLLVLGAAALFGECRKDAGLSVRNPFLVAADGYSVLVLAMAAWEGLRLFGGLALLLLAAGLLCVSFTRTLPWLAAATSAAVLAASFLLYGWILRDILETASMPGAAQLWPGFAAALALYAMRWMSSVLPRNPDAELRQRIFGSSASVIAAGAGVAAMSTDNASAVYGSVVLICALAAAVFEVPPTRREDAGEAAALVAALALQRIIWFFADDTAWFWSVQFWVVVLAVLAAYEFYRQRGRRGGIVLSASAALLSCTGLTTVVSADVAEQVWALVAHAGLLAFGVLASRRLFTVWGAAGVAVAVLWYLRGYTFLLLALLAAALIALAVWRLNRVRSDTAGGSVP